MDYNTSKLSKYDVTASFVLPLVISLLFLCFGRIINALIVGRLLTAFSVFAALMLNLLFVIYSVKSREKTKNDKDIDKLKIKLLNETNSNIQFEILIAIFVIIILIIFLFIPNIAWLVRLLSFLTLYLVFVFVVTLFMILKRTATIMAKD